MISPVKQAGNAIRCIDNLPKYNQAPRDKRGVLGDPENGYCCLGAACTELSIPFESDEPSSSELADQTGLMHIEGRFVNGDFYYNKHSLVLVNDQTNAGFKRISKLMRTHPEWMFKPEVAKLIRAYYGRKDGIKVPGVCK